MRPFGNDITNIPSNTSGDGGGGDPNDNNGNRNNTSPGGPDGDRSGGEEGNIDDRPIPAHIARIGGTYTFPPIAGQGVIRVVQRCEDAKENNNLGKHSPKSSRLGSQRISSQHKSHSQVVWRPPGPFQLLRTALRFDYGTRHPTPRPLFFSLLATPSFIMRRGIAMPVRCLQFEQRNKFP